MNRIFYALIALFILFSSTVNAKIKIPIGRQEVLIEVVDLPDTEDFSIKEGHYLDLATLHEEYIVAWVPIWITKDPKIVGYNKLEDIYYEIPDTDLDEIIIEQKLNKSELLNLPFFNKYGGKLIVLIVLVIIVIANLPSKKNKENAETREV